MDKKSGRAKLNKKILIPLIVLLVLAGAFAGARAIRTARARAYVLPVADLNMPYYADPMSFDGMVYDTESQNVFISPTQIVTDVFVTQGQPVSAGDKLLALDITAEEISLKMKELEVLMAQNDLERVQAELYKLRNTKPTEKPSKPDDPGTPDKGERTKIGEAWNYLDGTAAGDFLPADPSSSAKHGSLENPIRYLLTSDGLVYGSFLNAVKKQYFDCYVVIEVREGNLTGGSLIASWSVYAGELADAADDDAWSVIDRASDHKSNASSGTSSGSVAASGITGGPERGGDPSGGKGGNGGGSGGSGGDDERTYTAEELAEAIRQAEIELKRCDIALRRARLELQRQKDQTGDGCVYAKKDGVVTFVGDPDAPPQDGSPFIKVAAGEGVFVQGRVSELSLDSVSVGQPITAMSWETGMSYTGRITRIDDYPTGEEYYSGGNTNVSYYGFLAELDDASDLMTGSYLQLSADVSQEQGDSIYLMSAFIRSDAGGKYVMADQDGRLAKRYIRCGRTYYGEVTEVREGLSPDDMITFPYGAGAIEGAKTKVGEDQGVFWN
ncbi:MAG: hypothetical protein K5774_05445 [Clostridia bacterium]|nr:hypothetical protein [Clostridia bacterium]